MTAEKVGRLFDCLNKGLTEINKVMARRNELQQQILIAMLESTACCPVTLTDSQYFPDGDCWRYRKGSIIFHTEHGDFIYEIRYEAFDYEASGKLIEMAIWFAKCQS